MSTVYNVLIGGQSIGMTFNHAEALAWMSQSTSQLKKEIVAVPYRLARPMP